MFAFDEREINDRFGRRLNDMLPAIASRSAGFQPTTWPVLLWLSRLTELRPFRVEWREGGVRVTIDERLANSRNEDAIGIIVNELLNKLIVWVLRYRAAIGHPLLVEPLSFDYDETVFMDGEQPLIGTAALVTVLIKWSPLG